MIGNHVILIVSSWLLGLSNASLSLPHVRSPSAKHEVFRTVHHDVPRSRVAFRAAQLALSQRKPLNLYIEPVPTNQTASAAKEDCKCSFHSECTCEAALEFLDCISKSCSSGQCACHEYQYYNACVDMSKTCVQKLEFQCSKEETRCNGKVTKPSVHTVEKSFPDTKESSKNEPEPQVEPNNAEKGTSSDNSKARTAPPPFWDSQEEESQIRKVYGTTCMWICIGMFISCCCFSGSFYSRTGGVIGSVMGCLIPLGVLVYIIFWTDIFQTFWEGKVVGAWCYALCLWAMCQICCGGTMIAVTGYLAYRDKANAK